MRVRRLWTGGKLLFLLGLAVVILAPEWPAFGDSRYVIRSIVGPERAFDFVRWELDAFQIKLDGFRARQAHEGLAEEVANDVLGYLGSLSSVRSLEAHIEGIYTDPAITEPEAATVELRAQRDELRRELAQQQPGIESAVQSQVAAILAEEGLTLGGMTFPPVLMTMSPVPYMLIVSPRDRIAQVGYASLIPGLATESKEEMEAAVMERLDHSALVVPIGGLGTYPAMIRETSSIERLAEVTAHEWTHHWLSLRPLGVRYLDSPAMRTINETVASIVDQEIGPRVLERFYRQPAETSPAPPPGPQVPEPPAFDFSAEMAITRARVDELLAEGKVEEAEAYMEERRQLFVANNYAIRKLNQAYFAFYGGYAAEPGGAAGADPIGPMLREIRAASPSLRIFLDRVAGVTSLEDLQVLYEDVVGEAPAALR